MRNEMVALALAGLATPAVAGEFDNAAAESRLRGCLLASAGSAVSGDLKTKVAEARAFCGAQIGKVRDQRTAGLIGAAKAQAIRTLDEEIAVAVANFTGKTPNALDS